MLWYMLCCKDGCTHNKAALAERDLLMCYIHSCQ